MALSTVIPLTTKEGFEYLLNFTEFEKSALPDDIDIPLVDVTIEARIPMEQYNNAGTLFNMSSFIKGFLEEHNVIIYFYCSKDDILKSPSKDSFSNQEYRSHLFDTMFLRSEKDGIYINEKIIIDDNNEKHFIHLMSISENEKYFNKISTTILSFDPNKTRL